MGSELVVSSKGADISVKSDLNATFFSAEQKKVVTGVVTDAGSVVAALDKKNELRIDDGQLQISKTVTAAQTVSNAAVTSEEIASINQLADEVMNSKIQPGNYIKETENYNLAVEVGEGFVKVAYTDKNSGKIIVHTLTEAQQKEFIEFKHETDDLTTISVDNRIFAATVVSAGKDAFGSDAEKVTTEILNKCVEEASPQDAIKFYVVVSNHATPDKQYLINALATVHKTLEDKIRAEAKQQVNVLAQGSQQNHEESSDYGVQNPSESSKEMRMMYGARKKAEEERERAEKYAEEQAKTVRRIARARQYEKSKRQTVN